VPDADARHALLLLLAVLERHSRALRTLLARAGRSELKGLLGVLERRERALREAAWELRCLGVGRTTAPRRRNGSDNGGPVRQGVLPLPEPTRRADAGVMGGVIHSAVERRSEKLGTARARATATGRASSAEGVSHRTRGAVREAVRTRARRR
jgi:hypothetical protein